jgi:hypothetical protein
MECWLQATGDIAGSCVAAGLKYRLSHVCHLPGCSAIVFNRLSGIKEEVYEEGTHFMLPWFERPIIYDVRARPNVITSTSGSRDLQMVRPTAVALHWRCSALPDFPACGGVPLMR